ncbi:MAG TPA: hypothetical protein PKC23_07770 [Candidatus Desulfobacillus sp.]|nr:hypothetical protein [Candidatus Desulfobacillus sp.]
MRLKIILLALSLLSCGIASAQSPGQPVAPGQPFNGEILNIRAPDSNGWIVTGMARNGISFGKRGAESGETYGAQAIIFEMPPTNGSEELVAFVRKRIAAMNPPPRFLETRSEYRYTDTRGYPCVNVRAAFDDTAAVTPSGREQLKLQVLALYCRHPEQRHLGFFAAYSHRGKTADDRMEDSARSFIDSVVVPNK